MNSTTVAAERPSRSAETTPASAINAKLYGLRGSAPSFSAELMLLHKKETVAGSALHENPLELIIARYFATHRVRIL